MAQSACRATKLRLGKSNAPGHHSRPQDLRHHHAALRPRAAPRPGRAAPASDRCCGPLDRAGEREARAAAAWRSSSRSCRQRQRRRQRQRIGLTRIVAGACRLAKWPLPSSSWAWAMGARSRGTLHPLLPAKDVAQAGGQGLPEVRDLPAPGLHEARGPDRGATRPATRLGPAGFARGNKGPDVT